MPFQPLPDTGPEKAGSPDWGLALIRVITVLTFVYYQLWGLLFKAKDYIWDKTDWDFAAQIATMEIPLVRVVAPAFVILLTTGLIGVSLGFFTRLNALILTLLTGFILLAPLKISATLTPQTIALYLAVFVGLTIGGAGRVSLDYLMAGRKARRKQPS